MKGKEYETYSHHGEEVKVRSDLKGKHREYCLCYSCNKFYPNDEKKNCPISNSVYDNCIEFNIVTPVWECGDFEEKEVLNV